MHTPRIVSTYSILPRPAGLRADLSFMLFLRILRFFVLLYHRMPTIKRENSCFRNKLFRVSHVKYLHKTPAHYIIASGGVIPLKTISLTLIWLAAMIVLLIVEGIAPGLVSIWFAFGAFAAMIASLLHASLTVQLICFVVVSFASLCLTRPLVKKYVNAKVQPTNADAII